jgi:hypothetical protein
MRNQLIAFWMTLALVAGMVESAAPILGSL